MAAGVLRRQIEESIPDNTEDILQWLGERRELLKEKGILKKATEQALVLNRPLLRLLSLAVLLKIIYLGML